MVDTSPDLVSHRAWDGITIYNLPTHTAGIPDDAAKYAPGPPDRLVFADKPLDFQPGKKWAHTNLGYIVVGYAAYGPESNLDHITSDPAGTETYLVSRTMFVGPVLVRGYPKR